MISPNGLSAQPLRVALHRFESDPALTQRDGVNLAHSEINRLLGEGAFPDVQAQFHDFDHLLRDDAYARAALTDIDCVLCNVGPHAHYYHDLRERLGLGFRIVRDIKTALWSGYLLQEALCAPYLRPGDALLATSHYSRELTRRLFPHLATHPIHLFEPVLASAREQLAHADRKRSDSSASDAVVTLGYLGRLSEDKNFPQVVDLLVDLDRAEPGRYRLVAVGALHSPSCAPDVVARQIEERTGKTGLFEYRPPVPHDRVGEVLAGFDWFVFPSTSNLEVLGRVLIEAAQSGTPVLAARHAAAPELVHESSLLDVAYRTGMSFTSHFDLPLGTVDMAAAADRIRRGDVPQPPPRTRVNHLQSLRDALFAQPELAGDARHEPLEATPRQFVDSLQWSSLPNYADLPSAAAVIAHLLDWFKSLNGKQGADFAQRLAELEVISPFKERTRRFIAATSRTRCDFTNLGGIDIELCNIAGFHPRFWLTPMEQSPAFAGPGDDTSGNTAVHAGA